MKCFFYLGLEARSWKKEVIFDHIPMMKSQFASQAIVKNQAGKKFTIDHSQLTFHIPACQLLQPGLVIFFIRTFFPVIDIISKPDSQSLFKLGLLNLIVIVQQIQSDIR